MGTVRARTELRSKVMKEGHMLAMYLRAVTGEVKIRHYGHILDALIIYDLAINCLK